MSFEEDQDALRKMKRLSPEDIAKLDEHMAWSSSSFPPHWGTIYRGLLAEGFTEAQAMDLLKTYIGRP